MLKEVLKKVAAAKIWKQWGEIEQTPDGSYILRVSLRTGSSAPAMWRKFAMAYTQRKLNITYDDKTLTVSILKAGAEPEEL